MQPKVEKEKKVLSSNSSPRVHACGSSGAGSQETAKLLGGAGSSGSVDAWQLFLIQDSVRGRNGLVPKKLRELLDKKVLRRKTHSAVPAKTCSTQEIVPCARGGRNGGERGGVVCCQSSPTLGRCLSFSIQASLHSPKAS